MRLIFTILAGLIITAAFSQKVANDDCYTNNSKTKITRRSYPFNKAARILLVRYDATDAQGKPGFFIQDTVEVIPKKGKSVDTTKFLSSARLTHKGIDSLLQIINQQAGSSNSAEGVYTAPSNAIIFMDRKGRVFEYVVVCFTDIGNAINYTEISSKSTIKLGLWCSGKGQRLVNFFRQRSIEVNISKFDK